MSIGGVVGRLVVGLAILASCVSCASSKGGAPPLKICGTTLSTDPAGAVVDDATAGNIAVDTVTVDDGIFLRVASGCGSGAEVAVEPADAATVVKEAKARDGRAVAVELQPHRDGFTVRVTRSATSVTVVTVTGLTVETSAATTS